MDKLINFLVFVTILITCQQNVSAQNPLQIIGTLIQMNVAGQPLIHKQQLFDFDPDVAIRRRSQYIELHGFHGHKLTERVGLGIDGRNEERLAEQRARDAGMLQGANYVQFTDLLPQYS